MDTAGDLLDNWHTYCGKGKWEFLTLESKRPFFVVASTLRRVKVQELPLVGPSIRPACVICDAMIHFFGVLRVRPTAWGCSSVVRAKGQPMQVELYGQNGATGSRKFVLEKFPVEIGRSRAVGVQVNDPAVNSRHCLIARENGAVIVRDLNTKAGTFVNGERVETAELRPGDRLRVGTCTFLVQFDTPA